MKNKTKYIIAGCLSLILIGSSFLNANTNEDISKKDDLNINRIKASFAIDLSNKLEVVGSADCVFIG